MACCCNRKGNSILDLKRRKSFDFFFGEKDVENVRIVMQSCLMNYPSVFIDCRVSSEIVYSIVIKMSL